MDPDTTPFFSDFMNAKKKFFFIFFPVLRDVYPGSRISDPTFFHPGSRIRTVSIPDLGTASKNLSILTQKKWFLSSRKYDPGCSSRIPDPDADFLSIPDPGSRGSKRHRIPDPQH
jgi:hypothetical protein